MLVLAVVALYLLVVPVAWYYCGPIAAVSAAVAGVCCLVSAILALVSGEPFRAKQQLLHAMLVGMAFRMGLPLGIGLAIYAYAAPLVEAGFVYYLLIFFELTLLVEVFLSLPPAQALGGKFKRPESGSRFVVR